MDVYNLYNIQYKLATSNATQVSTKLVVADSLEVAIKKVKDHHDESIDFLSVKETNKLVWT